MAEGFLRNAQTLMQDKENDLDSAKKQLEGKLEETEAKEKFLDEKARQVNYTILFCCITPTVFQGKNIKVALSDDKGCILVRILVTGFYHQRNRNATC